MVVAFPLPITGSPRRAFLTQPAHSFSDFPIPFRRSATQLREIWYRRVLQSFRFYTIVFERNPKSLFFAGVGMAGSILRIAPMNLRISGSASAFL